jgi:hypothetical protein
MSVTIQTNPAERSGSIKRAFQTFQEEAKIAALLSPRLSLGRITANSAKLPKLPAQRKKLRGERRGFSGTRLPAYLIAFETAVKRGVQVFTGGLARPQ